MLAVLRRLLGIGDGKGEVQDKDTLVKLLGQQIIEGLQARLDRGFILNKEDFFDDGEWNHGSSGQSCD
jgi:hypothetical protein